MSLFESHPTGRTRTLSLSGSFNCRCHCASINVLILPTFWQGYFAYSQSGGLNISWNGFVIGVAAQAPLGSITGNQHFHNVFTMSMDSTGAGFSGGELRNFSANDGDIVILGGGGTGSPPAGVQLTGDNSGSFSIEFDVEEWFIVDGFIPILAAWPPNPIDGDNGLYLKKVEYIKIGSGVVRFSATSGAGTYSKSFDNATASRGVGYLPKLSTSGQSFGRYPGGDTTNIVASCAGIALGFPRTYTFVDANPPIIVNGSHPLFGILPNGSYPRGGYTNNCTSGAQTTMNVGWEQAGAAMSFLAPPPVIAAISGSSKNFDGSSLPLPGLKTIWYPGGGGSTDPSEIPVDSGTGTWSQSKTLHNVNVSGFGPFTGFSNFTEYKMYAYLDGVSLGLVGEESRDRALCSGWTTWDALTIQHLASLSVDAFSSTTGWAAGTHTTVTSGGSTVSLAASGGSGSATRTYSPIKNTEGYRYLDLKFRSTVGDNVAFRVTVGQKYWDVVSDVHGTYKTFTIDLMAPDGTLSVLPVQQDTRWPVDNATSNIPANENHFWGVNRITTFVVSNIPNGETIELDDSTLARKRTATAHLSAASSYTATVNYLSTGVPIPIRRFLLCQTDGRQSLEAFDALANITTFIAECQKIPGFTVTDLGGSGYFANSNMLPYFLGAGEGIFGSNNYLNNDITSPLTIKAQFLADAVGFYPGAGDVLGSGGYGQTTTLALVPKVFRGQGHGLALDASSKPLASTSVSIIQQPGSIASGSGTSDIGGYFSTGSPFGHGAGLFDFVGVPPITGIQIPPRKKVRINVGGASSGKSPTNLAADQGEYHRAHINGGGDIVYRASQVTKPSWDVFTTITSDHGWSFVRFCIDYRNQIELRACKAAGGLYRFYSNDRGNTWSAPELLDMAATQCSIRSEPGSAAATLLELKFIPDSGTTGPGILQARYRFSGSGAFSSWATILTDTSSNLRSDGSGFGHDKGRSIENVWWLTLVVDGESDPSDWYSAQLTGHTWKRF